MPRFEPFRALRFAPEIDLSEVIAPPYDVLSEADVDELAGRHRHNIVHVDVPREVHGDDRYSQAAARLAEWVGSGVMTRDDHDSFTIYRMTFSDALGHQREIVGVVGGLEVVDEGSGQVLPHERVTPKASTDRLDLTRATGCNLSPVWGLSLAAGLTDLLQLSGEPIGSLTVDGVAHSVERVSDPARLAAISAKIASDDVLIADGHHRYGISRVYRDEIRSITGSDSTGAELTLTFVSELVADQLSVEAIHRVYRGIDRSTLETALARGFTLEPAGQVDASVLASMEDHGRLCLLDRDGSATWLTPRPGAFDSYRQLDGAWLEHLLDGSGASVSYQHGLSDVMTLLRSDDTIAGAVLIRPVSVSEIYRTAREGLLMPPKSTFFTPKLRTGFVVREIDPPSAG